MREKQIFIVVIISFETENEHGMKTENVDYKKKKPSIIPMHRKYKLLVGGEEDQRFSELVREEDLERYNIRRSTSDMAMIIPSEKV